jgi:hypothetical protein
MALAALLGACGRADDTSVMPGDVMPGSVSSDDGALLAECGSPLGALPVEAGASETYSETLGVWWTPGDSCGLGIFTGECADGKRLLYQNGGFVSMIRYYDGESLVGVVSSGDVGYCPSLCPFSHFFGALEDVVCEAPAVDELCPGSSTITPPEALVLPFANGEAPGGCDY